MQYYGKRVLVAGIIILLISLNLAVRAQNFESDENAQSPEGRLVSQWIIFYSNIQRVVKELPPVYYDSILEKAAVWQARYCEKEGKVTHVAKVSEMKTVSDRIRFFHGSPFRPAENLYLFDPVKMSSGIIDEDAARKTAYGIVKKWMALPEESRNIMVHESSRIGVGFVKTKDLKKNHYYVCLLSDRGGYSGFGIMVPGAKSKKNENPVLKVEKYFEKVKTRFVITYTGGLELKIIEVVRDSELKTLPMEKKDNITYIFEKKGLYRGLLFIAFFDNVSMQLYPVLLLK